MTHRLQWKFDGALDISVSECAFYTKNASIDKVETCMKSRQGRHWKDTISRFILQHRLQCSRQGNLLQIGNWNSIKNGFYERVVCARFPPTFSHCFILSDQKWTQRSLHVKTLIMGELKKCFLDILRFNFEQKRYQL